MDNDGYIAYQWNKVHTSSCPVVWACSRVAGEVVLTMSQDESYTHTKKCFSWLQRKFTQDSISL